MIDRDMSREDARRTSLEGKNRRLVIVEACGLLVLGRAGEEAAVDEMAIDPLSNPVA